MSDDEGKVVVRLARSAIDAFVKEGRAPPPWSGKFLSEMRGVFVTLNGPGPAEGRLRGCIGFPMPVKHLGDAVTQGAMAAASEDPRFPPVEPSELDSITVEVSVLTPPQDLDIPRREIPSHVRIGQDGLLISTSYASGLLLPQVATEFEMDQIEFLSQACLKAGLPPDAWLDPRTRIQVFQAEIFAEKKPRGDVVRMTGGEP